MSDLEAMKRSLNELEEKVEKARQGKPDGKPEEADLSQIAKLKEKLEWKMHDSSGASRAESIALLKSRAALESLTRGKLKQEHRKKEEELNFSKHARRKEKLGENRRTQKDLLCACKGT